MAAFCYHLALGDTQSIKGEFHSKHCCKNTTISHCYIFRACVKCWCAPHQQSVKTKSVKKKRKKKAYMLWEIFISLGVVMVAQFSLKCIPAYNFSSGGFQNRMSHTYLTSLSIISLSQRWLVRTWDWIYLHLEDMLFTYGIMFATLTPII